MKAKLVKESLNDLTYNETGWEQYEDDELIEKYNDYEHRKYELGLKAAKDFFNLKKEIKKRNIQI